MLCGRCVIVFVRWGSVEIMTKADMDLYKSGYKALKFDKLAMSVVDDEKHRFFM